MRSNLGRSRHIPNHRRTKGALGVLEVILGEPSYAGSISHLVERAAGDPTARVKRVDRVVAETF
jgi:hypothetical protein